MAQWKEEVESNLWRLYQRGLDFQVSTGLRESLPKFVDFYEGKQWPDATDSTKNLPRPVVNIVKMICRNKKSAILSTPVKILYKSFSENTNVERLNDFAISIQRDIDQEFLDKLAVEDGVKKGSYFYHYYWDSERIGPRGTLEGGLACEIIDPLNIFFENPAILDEQKQEWILIASRMDINKIKALCDKDLPLDSLNTDTSEGNYSIAEQESDGKATLLTRYFRIDGEVYCERAIKERVISKPFKIAPDLSLFDGLLNGDSGKSGVGVSKKATLYPIVCGFYERKEGSIYGLSEVESLIPNQKAINFNIAMSLLNAQQCAWGKFVALPNALKGQKIQNTPGQVLIDYSGTGEGIKRMREEQLSDASMKIVETLTSLTRSFSGATEVMIGEAYSANMSGAAIAQLQSQALLPIEDLKATFWHVKKKQGLVLLQFLMLYYLDREFIKQIRSENGEVTEVWDKFSSRDYRDSFFDVVVEPTGGVHSSIASDITLLDTCLKNGKISVETYVKAYPDSAITSKEEILKHIRLENESELSRLRKELEELKKAKQS